jgi:hypothetical protein
MTVCFISVHFASVILKCSKRWVPAAVIRPNLLRIVLWSETCQRKIIVMIYFMYVVGLYLFICQCICGQWCTLVFATNRALEGNVMVFVFKDCGDECMYVLCLIYIERNSAFWICPQQHLLQKFVQITLKAFGTWLSIVRDYQMEPNFSFMALCCETDCSRFTQASPREVPEIMGLIGNKQ